MNTTPLVRNRVRKAKNRLDWLPWYTGLTIAIGASIALYAFSQAANLWWQLLPFAVAAIIAEMSSVSLFASSRLRLSVSSIVAIAAMVSIGPLGGIFTHLISGIVTIITTTFLQKPEGNQLQRVSWWQRSAFNISMWVIAIAVAGWTYQKMNGSPGEVMRWHNILPLILATTVDTILNVALLLGVIYLQTGSDIIPLWRQNFQWGVPITILGGVVGGGGLAVGYAGLGTLGLVIFMLPVLATGYAFHLYVHNMKGYVVQLEVINQKLEDANLSLLQTLGAVIDAFDAYTYGHSTQVAIYGRAIAEQMGLSPTQQTKILRGGLIHDIGKIGVKDAIISKPGRLTDEEYTELKRHTVIGAEIVSQMPELLELVPLVRSHHERWDGRGYPDGLKGEEILLEARILAVADSVDAMHSDRPYRPTLALSEVVKEVVRCAGAQFDPLVVTAFLRVVEMQDSSFFKNSAASVEQVMETEGITNSVAGTKYLKKSMLAGLPKGETNQKRGQSAAD